MKIFFGNIPGGPQNINVVQVTETDTAQAVAISKSKAISQVSESETAQAIGKTKNISVVQSTSSDSSQSVTVFIRKNISVVQVTETGLADEVSKVKSKAIAQTTETDSVENISKLKIKAVTQVLETDEALTISSELRIETVVETNTAQTITAQKIIPAVEATETNEAFAVTAVKQIAIVQVTESCSAEEIGRQKRKSICPSSSYEIYCDAVAGAIKYIFFLEKKSDNPYRLIDGMDYLDTASGTALSYKIGESASPTFSITLPDDGIEYTSGIVVEAAEGFYSGMKVQLFNTDSTVVTETDLSQAISKIKYKAVEQIIEVDFADDITPSQPGVVLVFRVNETETAFAITAIKLITISAAEENEFALGLAQILKRANISFAEETDLAVNISDKPTKYIEIILVSETDKAFVLRRFNPADVNDETLQVNSSVPLSVSIIDGYDVTGVSSDFDISVNIYQDTIEVNYETPYLQEHN